MGLGGREFGGWGRKAAEDLVVHRLRRCCLWYPEGQNGLHLLTKCGSIISYYRLCQAFSPIFAQHQKNGVVRKIVEFLMKDVLTSSIPQKNFTKMPKREAFSGADFIKTVAYFRLTSSSVRLKLTFIVLRNRNCCCGFFQG